ncbi:hypothetical protein [Pseudomonas lini]
MQRLQKKWSIEERSDSPKNHTNQNNHPNNLDVWLSRLSHISQFGLFALTIGALYFTVIPLYKTAALEESIARRESELSATNTKLEAATAALAKVKLEIYERNRNDLVKGIVSAAPLCSGLMEPPRALGSDTSNHYAESLLKVNAGQCLQDAFRENNAETKLTPDDLSYLKGAIETILTSLAQMQKQASFEIDSVPERAAVDPSILVIEGPEIEDVERLDRLINGLAPSFINGSMKLQVAIDSTRSRIYFAFSKAVVNEILKLRDLDWSKVK